MIHIPFPHPALVLVFKDRNPQRKPSSWLRLCLVPGDARSGRAAEGEPLSSDRRTRRNCIVFSSSSPRRPVQPFGRGRRRKRKGLSFCLLRVCPRYHSIITGEPWLLVNISQEKSELSKQLETAHHTVKLRPVSYEASSPHLSFRIRAVLFGRSNFVFSQSDDAVPLSAYPAPPIYLGGCYCCCCCGCCCWACSCLPAFLRFNLACTTGESLVGTFSARCEENLGSAFCSCWKRRNV
uniref:uncharacterized protein LOC114601368 n=1 Tax=Podarcis muralis TaxID=64176 RepID=UPI00109F6EBC|nr:uncharacterized protein LOC114601368 [Podarcis muralis]